MLIKLTKKVDYIIVGQGLAGTVLAHTLLKQNKSLLIVDLPSMSMASKVAAGLWNPVVFKRLVKSWMADDLLEYMDSFYPEVELLLNEKFYHKKQIVKPFSEQQEKVLWLKKTSEEIGKYLNPTIQSDFLTDIIHNLIGAAEVLNAGNIDTNVFLNASQAHFKSKHLLLEEAFDYNELILSSNEVVYKGIVAEKIIFCEGYKALDNPYFDWLPFKLTKGETLTIRIPLLHQKGLVSKVINKGVFVLPLGDGLYKVGATYEWEDLTDLPTEKGKTFLIGQLNKLLKVPFEIIEHKAGIRPTVKDRRPLIGLHTEHPNLGIFNGLGTKGVMLAPYFAKQFVDFLEMEIPLNKEVDIARFKK
jgi:glycine oxidase